MAAAADTKTAVTRVEAFKTQTTLDTPDIPDKSKITCVCFCDASVFVGLATGDVCLYSVKARDAKDPFGLAKARELASHYRWKASKFSPREFGEKIEIENRTTITDLTDDQLNARLAELTAAGAAAGDAGADGGKGPA